MEQHIKIWDKKRYPTNQLLSEFLYDLDKEGYMIKSITPMYYTDLGGAFVCEKAIVICEK